MNYSDIKYEIHGGERKLSFVGFYKDGDNPLVFRLPLGYENFIENQNKETDSVKKFNAAKELHIKFYKLFKKFTTNRYKKNLNPEVDQAQTNEKGKKWVMQADHGVIFYYNKFDTFGGLLNAFDELKIMGLERRLRVVEAPAADLRNFDNMANSRIYFSDDSFFDDQSLQPTPTIALKSCDIVGMYCFLLRDVHDELRNTDEKEAGIPLSEEILVQAENYQDKHLWPEAGCWSAEHSEQTYLALREHLEHIDSITAYKDDDYHDLYDVIALFLYPAKMMGEGEIWGLSAFWPVWEWMVLTRLATEYRKRLVWIEAGCLDENLIDNLLGDSFTSLGKYGRVLCRSDLAEVFDKFLKFGDLTGHPYPDAILKASKWELAQENKIYSLSTKDFGVTLSHKFLFDDTKYKNLSKIEVDCIGDNFPEIISSLEISKSNPGATINFENIYKELKHPDSWRAKFMSGHVLIDAKYKNILSDHAKNVPDLDKDNFRQVSYAATLACAGLPIAYSVYISPGKQDNYFENLRNKIKVAEDSLQKNKKLFFDEWSGLDRDESNHINFNKAFFTTNDGTRKSIVQLIPSVFKGGKYYSATKLELEKVLLGAQKKEVDEHKKKKEKYDIEYRSISLPNKLTGVPGIYSKRWTINELIDSTLKLQ